VVTACFRDRHLVRLLGTDGFDSGIGEGLAHVETIMEYLALVESTSVGSYRATLASLSRSPQGGVLIAVVGRTTNNELDALARMRRSFRAVVTVVCEAPVPASSLKAAGMKVVDATVDGTFGDTWQGLFRGGRTLAAVR
jgi:hypothetical protein